MKRVNRKSALGDAQGDLQAAQGKVVDATSGLDSALLALMDAIKLYEGVSKDFVGDDDVYTKIADQYLALKTLRAQVRTAYNAAIDAEGEGRDILAL